MANILNIPHRRQKVNGYCLPACAQMVLAYLNIFHPQEKLAQELGVRLPLGAPASNITRLGSANLNVTYTDGTLEDITNWLAKAAPVIAFIQAGELPHWREHLFQHAVVITGLDEQGVYLRDPAMEDTLILTPVDDFLLAWGEMDYLYATITRR